MISTNKNKPSTINSFKLKIKRQQIALALQKFVATPPRTSFITEGKDLELT
jgi:hypothetical protein